MIWPQDIESLDKSIYHRTFDSHPVLPKHPKIIEVFSLFYTLTEDLVDCHNLPTLEKNIKILLQSTEDFCCPILFPIKKLKQPLW